MASCLRLRPRRSSRTRQTELGPENLRADLSDSQSSIIVRAAALAAGSIWSGRSAYRRAQDLIIIFAPHEYEGGGPWGGLSPRGLKLGWEVRRWPICCQRLMCLGAKPYRSASGPEPSSNPGGSDSPYSVLRSALPMRVNALMLPDARGRHPLSPVSW